MEWFIAKVEVILIEYIMFQINFEYNNATLIQYINC